MALEIRIQRGVTVFGASTDTTTATLDSAVGSLTSAFVRITNSRHAASGRNTSDGINRNNDDIGCRARLTDTSTVTFTRLSTGENGDYRVHWEVWEYVGATSGANEFIVRYMDDVSVNSGNLSATTSLTDAASDTADLVPFVGGVTESSTGRNWDRGNFACTVDAGTGEFNLGRADSGGNAVVSIAVVEFTGSNWSVEVVGHDIAAAGTNESETISSGAWVTKFIVPTYRSSDPGLDETGFNVWPGASETEILFRKRSSAGGSISETHCYIISNVDQTVAHEDSITGGGTDFSSGNVTVNHTITAVTDVSGAAVIGTVDCNGAGTAYPRQFWGHRITTTTNVEWYRGRSGQAGDWAEQVIEFPTATGGTTHEGTLNLSGQGSTTFTGGIETTGSLNLSGDGSSTFTGGIETTGTLNLSGDGSSTFTGGIETTGTLNLSGQSSTSFTGENVLEGIINVSGEGGISLTAEVIRGGVLNLSGDGSTTFTPNLNISNSLNISGEGSSLFTGDVSGAIEGSLFLSGTGSTSFTGGIETTGELNLYGQGSTFFSGGTSTVLEGILNLTGEGSISSNAVVGLDATIDLSGESSSTFIPGLDLETSLNISGEGSVLLEASQDLDGLVNLSTEGSVTFAGDVSGSVDGSLFLSGNGSTSFTPSLDFEAGLDLSGKGSATLIGGIETLGTLNLSGQSSISLSGDTYSEVEGILNLSGEGGMGCLGGLTLGAELHASGGGTFFASGVTSGEVLGILNLTGEGYCSPSGNVDYTSELSVTGFGAFYGDLIKVGEYVPTDPPVSNIIETIITGFPEKLLDSTRLAIPKNWLKSLSRSSTKNKDELIRETLKAIQKVLVSNICVIRVDGTPQTVHCVPGNQERVIAAIRNPDKNIELPLTSIKHLETEDSEGKRRKYSTLIVTDSYWDVKERRAVRTISSVPKQVNISVNVNIWSKYQDDLFQIIEQLEYLFIPDLQIVTKFADNSKVFLKVNTTDETSDIGDGESRILRRSFTLQCETYIPSTIFRVTSSGEIEKFNQEIEIV